MSLFMFRWVWLHICVMFFSSVVKNPQHCYIDLPCGSDRPSQGHILFFSVSAFERIIAKDFFFKKRELWKAELNLLTQVWQWGDTAFPSLCCKDSQNELDFLHLSVPWNLITVTERSQGRSFNRHCDWHITKVNELL